jgi:hypothetical protein
MPEQISSSSYGEQDGYATVAQREQAAVLQTDIDRLIAIDQLGRVQKIYKEEKKCYNPINLSNSI